MSTSKYSGLAGTILLGSLLGLNYTQYARRKSPLADKGAAFDPYEETIVGSLFDKDGKPVPFGKTYIPGADAVNNLRDSLPDISPLVVCGVLSGLWAVRSFGAMNRVLNRRYNDIVYQIRRPDVIANRLTAWKFLGIGCLVVPGLFGSYFLYASRTGALSKESIDPIGSTLRHISAASGQRGRLSPLSIERTHFAGAVAEFSRTLRDGFKP